MLKRPRKHLTYEITSERAESFRSAQPDVHNHRQPLPAGTRPLPAPLALPCHFPPPPLSAVCTWYPPPCASPWPFVGSSWSNIGWRSGTDAFTKGFILHVTGDRNQDLGPQTTGCRVAGPERKDIPRTRIGKVASRPCIAATRSSPPPLHWRCNQCSPFVCAVQFLTKPKNFKAFNNTTTLSTELWQERARNLSHGTKHMLCQLAGSPEPAL